MALSVFSSLFLFGCSEEIVKRKSEEIYKNYLLNDNDNYNNYLNMRERYKEKISDDGYYQDDELSEYLIKCQPGMIHVSFASNSLMDITYYRDAEYKEMVDSGVYTIDMSVSEFIIDDYNNLIIVKLQTPKLSHISLCDKPKIHLYEYEKGWLAWNGNYDEGTQMSVNDHAEALSNLTDQLENNYDNLSAAKKSAENLVRAFIKNVNQDMNLKDGDIIIEYI